MAQDQHREEEETTYKIVRFFFEDHPSQVIVKGLTLDQAQAHCNDPETSSRTATSPEAVDRTRRMGPWFDGYTDESRS